MNKKMSFIEFLLWKYQKVCERAEGKEKDALKVLKKKSFLCLLNCGIQNPFAHITFPIFFSLQSLQDLFEEKPGNIAHLIAQLEEV